MGVGSRTLWSSDHSHMIFDQNLAQDHFQSHEHPGLPFIVIRVSQLPHRDLAGVPIYCHLMIRTNGLCCSVNNIKVIGSNTSLVRKYFLLDLYLFYCMFCKTPESDLDWLHDINFVSMVILSTDTSEMLVNFDVLSWVATRHEVASRVRDHFKTIVQSKNMKSSLSLSHSYGNKHTVSLLVSY